MSRGQVLLEAILSIVLVSVSLTIIAQSLLTNFRTGVRFQETVRSLIVMENQLGILDVTEASDDQLGSYPQSVEKPYDQFKVTARADTMNDHLKKVGLKLTWPTGKTQGRLDVTTMIYNPDET